MSKIDTCKGSIKPGPSPLTREISKSFEQEQEHSALSVGRFLDLLGLWYESTVLKTNVVL